MMPSALGSYELIFPEDWKKTWISWSKYKWEKDIKNNI